MPPPASSGNFSSGVDFELVRLYFTGTVWCPATALVQRWDYEGALGREGVISGDIWVGQDSASPPLCDGSSPVRRRTPPACQQYVNQPSNHSLNVEYVLSAFSSQALQKPGGKMAWNNSCYSGLFRINISPPESEDLLGMKYGLK